MNMELLLQVRHARVVLFICCHYFVSERLPFVTVDDVTRCACCRDEEFSAAAVSPSDVIHANKKDIPCIFRVSSGWHQKVPAIGYGLIAQKKKMYRVYLGYIFSMYSHIKLF